MIAMMLLLALNASAQTFDAQVENAVAASASQARKAPKPAKPAPPELRNGVIPRFQQKLFPLEAGAKCGLKSFTLEDYETREAKDGEAARITVMGAVIEATSPDCVQDYGIVQYIRGCVYHERYDAATGALLERTFDVARRLRGPRVVFSHPSWEVDRTAADPLLTADADEPSRTALYYAPDRPLRLRSDRASLMSDYPLFNEPALRTFLKDLDKPSAVAYVTDVPEGGVSSINEERTVLTASVSSLDFRTCVYRLKDVPASGDPAGEGVAPENGGPLHCFGWASRYAFDPAARDFVTDKHSGVDPYCAQAPARVPLPER